MDADTYQQLAMRTAGDYLNVPLERGLVVAALGLTGEAGEVADLVKKHIEQGHPLDQRKLLDEAGDVAWYLARLCTALDTPLSAILEGNVEKLKRRYPDGFSAEASLNRVE